MRKRSARKWLHFILDLLPVIFIPVFMIYSHRHTIDSYTAQVSETKVVDFNQLSNFSYTITTNETTRFVAFVSNNNFLNHKVYFKTNINFEYLQIWTSNDEFANTWALPNEDAVNLGSPNSIKTITGSHIFVRNFPLNDYLDTFGNVILYLQVFDLTQMFGSGNEPTIEQFNEWYPNSYYDYTLSDKQLFNTGNIITYDDNDIMSQITYAMYNATDKYFNFNKLFNMQDMYNWIQVNFFGGNAPLIIPIVWNIIVYELFMDILFLIYAVFMFIVDFATNMVDSFLSKSSKGGY